MLGNLKPDHRQDVNVDGYTVKTYSFGEGDETVFLLNGGPGLPCNYLLDPHVRLVDSGYRVITYDQLGCGNSDKPKNKDLWTISRYVEEVETVRKALGLGKIHLLGHSWGGWLGIEYSIAYPDNLQTVILENTCGDMPHLIGELERHRGALGAETVAMMQQHEAAGTIDHPEYQAAITILNYRHVCRCPQWPDAVNYSLNDWNMDVYGTMQGPNEFLYVGNLKDWNRLSSMHKISCPVLITVGKFDELSPACAMKMHYAVPNSEIIVFPNSSHMPFYEEPESYHTAITQFLAKNHSTS